MNNLKVLVVCLALSASGCVNGGLNPAVPPVVNVVDTTVCSVVPILISGTPVGEVCSAVAAAVNLVLQKLATMVTSRTLAIQPSAARVPLRYHGAIVGHIDPDLAVEAQKLLDAAK